MTGVLRWLTIGALAVLSGAACSSVVEDSPKGSGPDDSGFDGGSLTCQPGSVTIHRLNRTEFDNTVHDLFGLDLGLAASFPQDDSSHGYDNQAEVLTIAPLLMEKYEMAAAEIAEAVMTDAGARGALVTCDPASAGMQACAREILGRLASRAWRRPASEEDVNRLVSLVELAVREGDSFDEGLKLAIQAVVLSPRFLFRVEEDPPAGKVRNLDGWELASRLSYFLWSTMPDEELFRGAEDGSLLTREGLEAQVDRMLASPRAAELIDNFGGQWLTTRAMVNAQPDVTRFPEWDAELAAAMEQETRLVLREIIEKDRSLLDLLDADFTYVNERLAQHYGISGVKGESFVRVPAPDHRGGILSHGSFLTITSNPTRTSPVKRGKWVLAQLMCDEPPPAPPGVEGLPVDEGAATGSIREQMEAHRTDPVCAACHQLMDPIGFGLESFSATGAYREKDEAGFAIDSAGELPDGRTFSGALELAQLLKADAKLSSCMVEHVMTYALGRQLTQEDTCAMDAVKETFAAGNYTFRALAKGIVTSEPFRMRAARKEEGK